ncbi:MAG: CDP-alcohol phosphatidyltransferase family protein [Patescibacteria group bacterium]|nr:CDP-alcohol phosphatidyltransferase family protein [Patescibacteria group bacterium]
MAEKLKMVRKLREIIDFWILKLPWPNINPSYITILAIPLSIAFIFSWADHKILAIVILFFVIIFDWLDGVVARKYNRASYKGWLIDTITDRFSEGIIFIFFGGAWFYLFLVNVILNIVSGFFKKNLILPLRLIFYLYLIFVYTYSYFS